MGSLQLLLISGSTRSGSSNTAVLRTLQSLAPEQSAADLYDGLTLLPAFNPDDDHDPLPAPVTDLRERIERADAVVFCTPEYAGTLPGSLKNALDWTVRGGQFYGKPVAWLNVANQGRGEGAAASLEVVLRYVGVEVVQPACLRLPVDRELVGPDGTIADPAARQRLRAVWTELTGHLGGLDRGPDVGREKDAAQDKDAGRDPYLGRDKDAGRDNAPSQDLDLDVSRDSPVGVGQFPADFATRVTLD